MFPCIRLVLESESTYRNEKAHGPHFQKSFYNFSKFTQDSWKSGIILAFRSLWSDRLLTTFCKQNISIFSWKKKGVKRLLFHSNEGDRELIDEAVAGHIVVVN